MNRRRWLELVFHSMWVAGLGWLAVEVLRRGRLRRQLRKVAVTTVTELHKHQQLQVELNGRPVAVQIQGGGRIVALDLRCTHGSCTVQYQPSTNQFFCPCHGGAFDAEGNVLAGPPRQPLAHVPIRTEDGIIYLLDTP